jgi:hypothetical protein
MVADYTKAKIYRIVSEKTDHLYVGSTTRPLLQRYREHRNLHKWFVKGKTRALQSCTSSSIFKFNDARIELIEEYPCANKLELDKREAQIIVNHFPNVVNRFLPGREWQGHRKPRPVCYIKF